ncbi:WD40-repeat-containing domain protein [Halteromyces radiatus]|uniref:WD40-repeat-containing domain protein n=1 Tax=Halteromyces radiatus TaxID=101107 RepID=UPI00221F71C7|nr:WD40-repeat-containing domain protein [Halteromyces radiatus]KAI8099874.1 WD40-repeat-containing domain protein [Halteromyces radiatus]
MDPVHLVTKELAFTPYDVKWIPSSSRFCAVGGTGRSTGKITIFDFNGKIASITAETETGTPFRCCTLGAADMHTRHVATGDFNGGLELWDTQRLELPIETIMAHESIIHSIDGTGGGTTRARELVTGSRDGLVKVWDTRQIQSPVFTVKSSSADGAKHEVWAVAFGDWQQSSQRIIAIGYDNGIVRLLDISAAEFIWETDLGDGVCSIDFSKKEPKYMVATTLTGAYVIQLSTGKSTKLESPPDTTLWSVQHTPQTNNNNNDDPFFAITSGDGSINIWDHNNVAKSVGSASLTNHPTISLDWHPTKKGLFVCSSFDQTLRIGCIEKLLL